jgi:hypothetical protein
MNCGPPAQETSLGSDLFQVVCKDFEAMELAGHTHAAGGATGLGGRTGFGAACSARAFSASGPGGLGRGAASTPERLDEFAERLLVHVGNGDIG